MKKCCKKWKKRMVGYVDKSYKWVSFCPECGSSLKEERRANGEQMASKWCECENPTVEDGTGSTMCFYQECRVCHKPIEKLIIKPTPKLPERIDSKKWAELDAKSGYVGQPDFFYIGSLIKKYNKLIDYLKEKK